MHSVTTQAPVSRASQTAYDAAIRALISFARLQRQTAEIEAAAMSGGF